MRCITSMLLWFVFLVLPLMVSIVLNFATGGSTFDYTDLDGKLSKESLLVGYGIAIEIPWIVVSGLALFSTVKSERPSKEPF